MKEIISIPNASRTFTALRSLGYNLFSSIADIIDNSITDRVNSKNVLVRFNFNQAGNIVCRIEDDGMGMNHIELEEAMRIGTETSYENNSLGKFGLGMKTASLSHCNILTVISKRKGSEISAYRWDMRKIDETNEWTLLQLSRTDIEEILKKEETSLENQGTIVMWDELFNIDRNYRSYKNVAFAENYYYRLLSDLELHLGMTYHRFLDGSLGEHNGISISINGKPVTAWDPFCLYEGGTEQISLNTELSELYIDGNDTPVKIKGYVLPNKEGFSSEEKWKEAKGPLSWNDSQGYYIYRANRIIRFGGWHNTKAKDEHDKLARLSIDIDPSLDDLFRITVNKTKVQFPQILYHHLKNRVNKKVIKKAKSRYNKTDAGLHVKNKIRRASDKIEVLSQELLHQSQIKTAAFYNGNDDQGSIKVQNPGGTWLSNRIQEFLKYGGDKDYEIISDHLEGEQLWRIICSKQGKFKVIINASHPFYKKIYASSANKEVTNALDALIFSLAFAELYNKNDQNAHLFDTFKTISSQVLKRLTKEEIL